MMIVKYITPQVVKYLHHKGNVSYFLLRYNEIGANLPLLGSKRRDLTLRL